MENGDKHQGFNSTQQSFNEFYWQGSSVPKEKEIWVHRKGGRYEILHIAHSSNDCHQLLVVYKALQDSDFPAGTVWVRTLTEFLTPGRFTKEG